VDFVPPFRQRVGEGGNGGAYAAADTHAGDHHQYVHAAPFLELTFRYSISADCAPVQSCAAFRWHMSAAKLRPYASPWGHCAASPDNEPDFEWILDAALADLLSRWRRCRIPSIPHHGNECRLSVQICL
jgi:hypothetical protein